MATVRSHLAPQQPPPPPPPAAALPWSPPYTRCRTADRDTHGRKEGMAESCCPTEVAAGTAIDGDVFYDSDDDDCRSCVDGSEGSAGQDDVEAGSDNALWWRQQSSSGNRCFLWAPNPVRTTTANPGEESEDDDDGDPKAAAVRRQEEDRKFWEECLTSGYP